MDTRVRKLAGIFLEHSLKLKPEEHLIISISDFTPLELLQEVYKQAIQTGAHIYLDVMGMNYDNLRADYAGLINIYLKYATKEQLKAPLRILQNKISWADKYLRIVTIHNKNFLTQVSTQKINVFKKNFYPEVRKIIKKPWLLTYFPSTGMAQDAGMSYNDLVDFYYRACNVDYTAMSKRIAKLQSILDQGKFIRVITRNTDLTLGIANRQAQGTDAGIHNIPDGECFLGPVEDQTTGNITFEYPQSFMGNEISGIKLEFKQGKIVRFSAEKGQKQLKHLLEDDPGNRRIGELGIGMNSMIKKYIKEILFDEKITGTVHLALGNSYEQERGGGKNKGTIHWDLVKDLRYEDSKLLVDNRIIIKNGKVLV